MLSTRVKETPSAYKPTMYWARVETEEEAKNIHMFKSQIYHQIQITLFTNKPEVVAEADADKYSGLISMSPDGTYTISQVLTRAIAAASQELGASSSDSTVALPSSHPGAARRRCGCQLKSAA